MDLRISQAFRPAFALTIATDLLWPLAAQAAVPSGATATPAALRQAYIDAVTSRNPAALEALFDLTQMRPGVRAAFRKHISADFEHKIKDVALKDPEPTLRAQYAMYHAYFPQPVIKTLKITFATRPGETDVSEYYIGSSAGRCYFVSAVQAGK